MLPNLVLLRQMLEKKGYKVRAVAEGPMALTAVAARAPELILLDVDMPEMNGFQVAEKLKSDPETAAIPILFISARAEIFSKIQAFTSGGVDYITKPFEEEEVLVRVKTHLELSRLRQSLEEMVEERTRHIIELNQKLIEQEKLAAIGNVAAGIVHDLRNPVAIIKGYAELADDQSIGREDRRRCIEVISQEADRISSMVQDLLDFSRGSVSIKLREIELEEYMERVKIATESYFTERKIKFVMNLNEKGMLKLDPDRFLRAIVNIAGNAADILDESGRFEINVTRRDDAWVFRLIDNGPGIPEEIRDTLFEPFVTHAKPHGTGLGMAITRSIVDSHGGNIEFETGPEGTTFIIVLPISA